MKRWNYFLFDACAPCVYYFNFSSNLQCNSTLRRCKIGKYKFPSQFANIFLTYQTFVTNLHLLRVELRCELQEKLHRVTGTLVRLSFIRQLNPMCFSKFIYRVILPV